MRLLRPKESKKRPQGNGAEFWDQRHQKKALKASLASSKVFFSSYSAWWERNKRVQPHFVTLRLLMRPQKILDSPEKRTTAVVTSPCPKVQLAWRKSCKKQSPRVSQVTEDKEMSHKGHEVLHSLGPSNHFTHAPFSPCFFFFFLAPYILPLQFVWVFLALHSTTAMFFSHVHMIVGLHCLIS